MENLENIREYGLTHNVPISKDDTLCFLLETIKNNKCAEILEIGTAIGYSSIAMASKTCCTHIDTLEIDEERYNIANSNIAKLGLSEKITTHLTDAKVYLENCQKKYDFVYLDGPKGQYINYLPLIVDLLKPNGIIFADNLFFHGMVTGEIPISKGCRAMIKGLKNYIKEITTNPMFSTEILEIGDGIGITKKRCI